MPPNFLISFEMQKKPKFKSICSRNNLPEKREWINVRNLSNINRNLLDDFVCGWW